MATKPQRAEKPTLVRAVDRKVTARERSVTLLPGSGSTLGFPGAGKFKVGVPRNATLKSTAERQMASAPSIWRLEKPIIEPSSSAKEKE